MDEYLDGTDKEGLLCSSSENNTSFDMDVAKIPQAMIKKDQYSVAEKIALSKRALITLPAVAEINWFGWSEIYKNDGKLGKSAQIYTATPLGKRVALQRLVLGASGLGAQVGDCWLQYAKLCRSAGYYETANQAILEAQASGPPKAHMEKALVGC